MKALIWATYSISGLVRRLEQAGPCLAVKRRLELWQTGGGAMREKGRLSERRCVAARVRIRDRQDDMALRKYQRRGTPDSVPLQVLSCWRKADFAQPNKSLHASEIPWGATEI